MRITWYDEYRLVYSDVDHGVIYAYCSLIETLLVNDWVRLHVTWYDDYRLCYNCVTGRIDAAVG